MSTLQATDLPHVMAALNAATVVTLIIGFGFIVLKRPRAHRACMLTALGLGAVFLVVYAMHQVHKFGMDDRLAMAVGDGISQPVFYAILIAHVIAAISVAVLVPWTLIRAFASRFNAHRRIARVALPVWIFVCASGLAVYAFTDSSTPVGTTTAFQQTTR